MKLAVRMFNIGLQQRQRNRKVLLEQLRRIVDDMNVAGGAEAGGRIVFLLEHSKCVVTYTTSILRGKNPAISECDWTFQYFDP